MALFVPRRKPIDYISKTTCSKWEICLEGLTWRYTWTSVLRSLYWAVASLSSSGKLLPIISYLWVSITKIMVHILILDIRTPARDGSLTETDSDINSGSVSKPDGYIVLCRTFHIARTWTRIPTLYFCVGQESKSKSISSNVNEPWSDRITEVRLYQVDMDAAAQERSHCNWHGSARKTEVRL